MIFVFINLHCLFVAGGWSYKYLVFCIFYSYFLILLFFFQKQIYAIVQQHLRHSSVHNSLRDITAVCISSVGSETFTESSVSSVIGVSSVFVAELPPSDYLCIWCPTCCMYNHYSLSIFIVCWKELGGVTLSLCEIILPLLIQWR